LEGSDGNDTISGLAQEDVLYGYAGDDQIDGGSDLDIAVYFGIQSMYTLVVGEPRGGKSVTLRGLSTEAADGDTLYIDLTD